MGLECAFSVSRKTVRRPVVCCTHINTKYVYLCANTALQVQHGSRKHLGGRSHRQCGCCCPPSPQSQEPPSRSHQRSSFCVRASGIAEFWNSGIPRFGKRGNRTMTSDEIEKEVHEIIEMALTAFAGSTWPKADSKILHGLPYPRGGKYQRGLPTYVPVRQIVPMCYNHTAAGAVPGTAPVYSLILTERLHPPVLIRGT